MSSNCSLASLILAIASRDNKEGAGRRNAPVVRIIADDQPAGRKPRLERAERALARGSAEFGGCYEAPPFARGSNLATAIMPTTCPSMISSTDSVSPRIVGAGYAGRET